MSYATLVDSPNSSAAKLSADGVTASTQPATGFTGLVGTQPAISPAPAPSTPIETVGAGMEFSTIAQAVAAAANGTTILVRAGTYTNDFATIARNVTIIGVGGVVNMVATIPPPNLKGILTVDASATIENFAFSGAAIDAADGGNGAGIRYEGGNLVLRNDSFTNNQNGILAFPVLGLPSNTIVLDHDTFNHNGSGSGFTHNAYIGGVDSLTVTNSIFEQAVVGHELKSRALVNTIVNNSFYDGPTSTASYSIDLPDGGQDVVKNNTIEKGPNSENNAAIHFGGEGIPYAGSSLLVQGNAFVADKSGATGVLNQTAISVTVTGNTFLHMTGGQVEAGPASETNNWDGAGNEFANGTLIGVLPGATQIYTDANPHTILLNGAGGIQAVEGGGGLLTATAIIGHVVVIGGSGGLNYTEVAPSGGNNITTAAKATDRVVLAGQDTLDSEGNDTINTVNSGNITGAVNGSSTIADGAGSNQWSIDGHVAITSNNSNELIFVGAAGSVTVHGTNRYLQLSANGGQASYDVAIGGVRYAASLNGGAYQMRTYGGASNITTAGGATGVAMNLAGGVFNITSAGSDVINAGFSTASVIVSGAAKVYAGSGQLSVFGRSDFAGAKIYGAGGSVTLNGDTGHLTYYGSATANTVQSYLSSDMFVGGAGRMTINGGSREQITGGSGGVVFNSDGGGGNTVTTAVGASDMLNLSGSDTVDSYGLDTITATGSLVGAVHGESTITSGAGSVNLTLGGRDTFTGAGQTSLSVTRGANASVTVSGTASASEAGGAIAYANVGGGEHDGVTLMGGSASISSSAGQGISVNTNAGVSSVVVAGGGKVAVYSKSNDLLHAGQGADYIQVDAKGAVIWGGSGSAIVRNDDWTTGDVVTIYGGSGAVNYDQGPAALTFTGGSGPAVINGEYGSLAIKGGSGSLAISGGDRGMSFVGGSGAATIAAPTHGARIQFGTGATTVTQASYGAADVYTFTNSASMAQDAIFGFRPGTDQVVLSGVAITSEAIVKGSADLVLSNGNSLVLSGVTALSGIFSSHPGI